MPCGEDIQRKLHIRCVSDPLVYTAGRKYIVFHHELLQFNVSSQPYAGTDLLTVQVLELSRALKILLNWNAFQTLIIDTCHFRVEIFEKRLHRSI